MPCFVKVFVVRVVRKGCQSVFGQDDVWHAFKYDINKRTFIWPIDPLKAQRGTKLRERHIFLSAHPT